MRLIRYGALILGIVLVLGVTVGYVVRRGQVTDERDVAAERLADQVAGRLASTIEVADLTVRLAGDPATAAAALPAVNAVDWSVGTGQNDTGRNEGRTTIDVRITDDRMVVVAIGPRVAVTGTVDMSGVLDEVAIDQGIDDPAWFDNAAVVLVASGAELDIAGERGRHVASAAVDLGPAVVAGGVTVVVAVPGGAALEPGEQAMFLVLLALAVLLLVLAGATVVAEARSLLHRARFDPLTGLPNRSEFERRGRELLSAARRSERSVCVLLVDLDGFKEINDTRGHRIGDEVLTVVGSRLRHAVRESDLVARWGGDEFVVMMPGISDVNLARTRAGRLAGQITDEEVGSGLRIGVSAGVALFPLHGEELDELVEAADAAMYEAKRAGEVYRLAAVGAGSGPTLRM